MPLNHTLDNLPYKLRQYNIIQYSRLSISKLKVVFTLPTKKVSPSKAAIGTVTAPVAAKPFGSLSQNGYGQDWCDDGGVCCFREF